MCAIKYVTNRCAFYTSYKRILKKYLRIVLFRGAKRKSPISLQKSSGASFFHTAEGSGAFFILVARWDAEMPSGDKARFAESHRGNTNLIHVKIFNRRTRVSFLSLQRRFRSVLDVVSLVRIASRKRKISFLRQALFTLYGLESLSVEATFAQSFLECMIFRTLYTKTDRFFVSNWNSLS